VVADFTVRPLRREEVDAVIDHLAEVAEERRWIASEPPIPRERWREQTLKALDEPLSLVLVALDSDRRVIGELSAFGRQSRATDIGMSVAREWRGKGVGTALMQACVDWARERGIHKLALQVWPHNEAALRLYEKFGFQREGLLRRHYRRQSGEEWDVVAMGLLLE
jgi:RimJ/RimL family protein N-acetyltransferase